MITVVREGPTSRISAKKSRKATAVQTTESTATDPMVSAESDAGMVSSPGVAYSVAVTTSEAQITPIAGR